ncbi:MAG: hypothetical protein BRC44_06025 [Cyanobacteria bacterium QS_4_48_99]|nr:MAG: hypothetical protein BRC44_06025 [Cyanobacteria bacterium QS_4_48_99]
MIAVSQLSFWLGTFTIDGILFLLQPQEIPSLLNLPLASLLPLGAIFFLALVIGYLVLSGLGRRSLRMGKSVFSIPPPRVALAQIAVYATERGLEVAFSTSC